MRERLLWLAIGAGVLGLAAAWIHHLRADALKLGAETAELARLEEVTTRLLETEARLATLAAIRQEKHDVIVREIIREPRQTTCVDSPLLRRYDQLRRAEADGVDLSGLPAGARVADPAD